MMSFSVPRLALAVAVSLLAGCYSSDRLNTNVMSATGLAYDLVGSGEPLVVLIHGSNLDRRMWDGEVTWLKKEAQVLRYDLRGQGASTYPEEPFSNHADLLDLLDEIGADEVTLIGLSSAAQVALDVALEAPHRVERMVLVSPSLRGYLPDEMPAFFSDLSAALQAQDFKRANEVLLTSSIMSVPLAFKEHVRTMVEENSRLWTIPFSRVEQVSPPALERLEQIQIPTLVLLGEDDLEAIQAQGQLLEGRLINAGLVEIPGGGHLLNMTSPKAFQKAVNTFLTSSAN